MKEEKKETNKLFIVNVLKLVHFKEDLKKDRAKALKK